MHVLATLGARGGAVILGRGSPFVLRPEHTLRVLVTAPAEFRARRLAKAQNLEEGEARRRLGEEERERLEFLRFHFGVSPDDPGLYDLVVNTAELGIDGASTLVVDALHYKTDRSGAAHH